MTASKSYLRRSLPLAPYVDLYVKYVNYVYARTYNGRRLFRFNMTARDLICHINVAATIASYRASFAMLF